MHTPMFPGSSVRPPAPVALAALAAIVALAGCSGKNELVRTIPHHQAAPKEPASAPSTAAGPKALPEDVRVQIERARDKVFPALVNITVINVSYWGGKEKKDGANGSGTVISPDGLIVTNHHVVQDGVSFKVTLANKKEVGATLVGEDPMTDLAVLRINMKELGSDTPLAVASFGDSDELEVGQYVMAMGAPYGLARSFTLGVVSNTERVFTGLSGDSTIDAEFDFDVSTDIFTRWVQHDALILPGNSGGPLVNLRGEIVGINTRGGSGMGFANPSNFARRVVEEIIRSGEVTRSTIGANFKSVKRMGIAEGVLINSIIDQGPADKAGLKPGDVITALAGRPVSARFPEEIPLVLRTIADTPVGATIEVRFTRAGEAKSAAVVTEKMVKERGKETALRLFGLSVAEITPKMARNRNLAGTDGVLVIGVRGGGPSQIAEPAVAMGDVLRSIDGQPVRSLADAIERYQAIAAKDPLPEFTTLEFDRAGKNMLTLIKPKPDKPEDPPRELPKAWIGVATQPVLKDLAKQLGSPDAVGFRVTRVYPGTNAEKAGLRVGDIITKLDQTVLSPRGMQDAGMFQREVRKLSVGGTATLAVLRDGKTAAEISLPLERTRLTQEEARRDTNRDFELTVRELTFFDIDDNRWSDRVQGVIVQSVERVGWAGLAGVLERDLIQSVNGESVTDLASYRRAMERVAKEQPPRVTFVILRGTRTQFMFAEPEWKPAAQDAKK